MLAETRIEDTTTDTLITVFEEHAEHLANITINNFEAMKIEGKSYNAEKRIEELQRQWFYFNVRRYIHKYRNISRITLSVSSIIEVEDEAIEDDFSPKRLRKTI
ncbi:hypothetical protein AXF42_Ash017613 [Apostasia shenzhenica]|uniref:Replication factor A C-terminal domain-containing protein n=1 Tax=Apostasia shenzhenica TaxID=1088818 RepID=A0A2I0A5B7_9ASPA|nr:hypothetical protein AXF42_Ash017613 [Apostasia shenzhenica]